MIDWTLDELMVTALARELTSDDVCVNGASSFLPVAAIGLARRTHAPGLIHLGGAVGVDPQWSTMGGSTVGGRYREGASATLNHPDEFWPYVQSGRVTTSFHRAAQIDARGNLNNSRIRREGGDVRLPGGAAMGDIGALVPRVLLWSTTHVPRTFVERVDMVTCPGYLDAPGDRERLGMPGGPIVVVTNLAVLSFDSSGRMALASLHPGVSPELVRRQTGFALQVAPDVPETKVPTPEQLSIIRAIDPRDDRRSEFRVG